MRAKSIKPTITDNSITSRASKPSSDEKEVLHSTQLSGCQCTLLIAYAIVNLKRKKLNAESLKITSIVILYVPKSRY